METVFREAIYSREVQLLESSIVSISTAIIGSIINWSNRLELYESPRSHINTVNGRTMESPNPSNQCGRHRLYDTVTAL